MQDVLLDRGTDPPHGIGRKAEALVGVEPLHGLHQADIAFRDQLGQRQAIAAIAHGDLGDQTQMAGDQFVGGIDVTVFAPALGKLELLFGFQHGKLPDFPQVSRETAFRRKSGKCSLSHGRSLS